MMKKTNYKKYLIKLMLSAGIAIIVGILFFFGVQIYIVQSTKKYVSKDMETLPECDAVLVLGAFVEYDGTPSLVLMDRLNYGLELYNEGKAKKIIVSGDHGQKHYNEVAAMKDYLIENGVPREDIFMDHAGFNTYDSMYRAKEIFGVESLLISTQDFHINRSVYIARKLKIDAYGYPCEDKTAYRMTSLNIRESLARVKAFGDVTVKRKPKYLGNIIPISGNGIATEG